MSNSDGGLDGDGVTEEIHFGTSLVQPVIYPKRTIAVSQDVDKQAI